MNNAPDVIRQRNYGTRYHSICEQSLATSILKPKLVKSTSPACTYLICELACKLAI